MKKLSFLLALGTALLTFPRGAGAGGGTVAVVPLGEGEAYSDAARVALALRHHLAQGKGYLVRDPALLVGEPPQAPTSLVAQARAKLALGLKLYDNLDFSKARAALREAITLYQRALTLGAKSKEYIRALHYLAAAAFFDNDRAAAQRTYLEAIAFAPAQLPDKNIFSPDVLATFDEAKVLANANRGTLRAESKPHAEVWIDGQIAGVSPLVASDVLPGHHLVLFRRAGYSPSPTWVVVGQRQATSHRVELKSTAGLADYAEQAEAASEEMVKDRPGKAVAWLGKELGASAVLLVARQEGGTMLAAWAEGVSWVRRYRGPVPAGAEATFALALMSAGTSITVSVGCERSAECPAHHRCQDHKCIPEKTSRGFYATWWFWTIVGVAVAGGTTGLVLGLQPKKVEWTAEISPGPIQ
jgi:hypothetical protein